MTLATDTAPATEGAPVAAPVAAPDNGTPFAANADFLIAMGKASRNSPEDSTHDQVVSAACAAAETSAAPSAALLASAMDAAAQGAPAAPAETVAPPADPVVVPATVEIGDTVLFVVADDAASEARAIRATAAVKVWRKMHDSASDLLGGLPFAPVGRKAFESRLARHYSAVLVSSAKVQGGARWAIAACMFRPSAVAIAQWSVHDSDKILPDRLTTKGWTAPKDADKIVGYAAVVAPSPEACAYVGAALGVSVRPDAPVSDAIKAIVAWAGKFGHVSNKVADKAMLESKDRGTEAYRATRSGLDKVARGVVKSGKRVERIGKDTEKATDNEIKAGLARGQMRRAKGSKSARRTIAQGV